MWKTYVFPRETGLLYQLTQHFHQWKNRGTFPRPCALRWLHCCDPAASCRLLGWWRMQFPNVYPISNWLVLWILDVFFCIVPSIVFFSWSGIIHWLIWIHWLVVTGIFHGILNDYPMTIPSYWEFLKIPSVTNTQSIIFFRGVGLNHQPGYY